MDLAFDDIVLGLNRGRGHFFNFWVLQWFYNAKVYFSRLMRLNQAFLASYWSEGFETFLQVSALASHGMAWIYANFTPTPGENNQKRQHS
jgi:hypothetical protein